MSDRTTGMNNRLTRNFSYAFISNVINMVVSILPTLVLPRLFGSDIASYGYYQVYAFYITYVGLLHFGAVDGIYLKEGGKDYSRLDFDLYSSQFRILTILELIISVAIGLGSLLFFDSHYVFITWMVSANIILLSLRTFFLYIFQATNCIKQYSIITIIGRLFYAVCFIVLLLFRVKDYELYIVFDVVAKFISLMVAFVYGKAIIKASPVSIKAGLLEFADNVKVGCQLMFATVSGMLVTGIIRWGIQLQWDIETYGKISLALSSCNMISVLINAVAMVLYPELKRKNAGELNHIYNKLQNIVMVPLMGVLIVYYPFKAIMEVWVPNYSDSLNYLAILFPISILSVKMNVMIQTYMKVLRMEKAILVTNLAGLVFAVVTMYITVFIIKSLDLAIISIVLNNIFRNVISEIVLKTKMNIKDYSDLIFESILIVLFIVSGWLIGGIVGLVFYFVSYIGYLWLKRKAVTSLLMAIKKRRQH